MPLVAAYNTAGEAWSQPTIAKTLIFLPFALAFLAALGGGIFHPIGLVLFVLLVGGFFALVMKIILVILATIFGKVLAILLSIGGFIGGVAAAILERIIHLHHTYEEAREVKVKIREAIEVLGSSAVLLGRVLINFDQVHCGRKADMAAARHRNDAMGFRS